MLRIEKLAELCRHKTVYIQTHNFPDPDAIASAFGVQKLLRHFGIDSTICYAGRIDNLSTSKMLQMFHIEMWAFTHGIASMLATGFQKLSDELISQMMSDAYNGLVKRFAEEI